MLLESLIPVVTCIRGMEEEDGVPLSYPYPSPATTASPMKASVSYPLSSPFLFGQGQGQGQTDERDSSDSSHTKGVRMARKFGRVSDPPIAERTDVLTTGGKRARPGVDIVPSVLAYGVSSYGVSNVQSEGAVAASKWRAAVLASSTISSKVRDP
jgi:hypothetical protein